MEIGKSGGSTAICLVAVGDVLVWTSQLLLLLVLLGGHGRLKLVPTDHSKLG